MKLPGALQGLLHLLAAGAQGQPDDFYGGVGNPQSGFAPDPFVLSPGRRVMEDITASRIASYRGIPLIRLGYNV